MHSGPQNVGELFLGKRRRLLRRFYDESILLRFLIIKHKDTVGIKYNRMEKAIPADLHIFLLFRSLSDSVASLQFLYRTPKDISQPYFYTITDF